MRINRDKITTSILSYPRSGNHLMRFIVEYISSQKTDGSWVNMDDVAVAEKCFRDPTLLSHVKDTFIAKKQHSINLEPVDKIIFIIRDPFECLVSGHEDKDIDNDNYSTIYAKMQNQYVSLIAYYDMFPNKKIMVRYEQMIDDPCTVAKNIHNFLEIKDDIYLKKFLENSEELVKKSKQCYSKTVPAHRNRSKKNAHYWADICLEKGKLEDVFTAINYYVSKSKPLKKYLGKYVDDVIKKYDITLLDTNPKNKFL